MSIKVSVPLSNNINTSVVSRRVQTKVENLQDIDLTGVQDGYTLIYNNTTKKWEAADPATEVTLSTIDGGTY